MSANAHINFKDLYDTHSKMVYNLALQYVQNEADAEDIVQEVFVKVHQHLPKFNPAAASVTTWIYRITINQSLDFLRAKQAKKRKGFLSSLFGGEDNEPIVEAAHFNHPGVLAEDKEALQRVFAAINQLPENQRTALILMRLEGKSQKETAEIMELSAKAVESLVQRARQALGKKLGNNEG